MYRGYKGRVELSVLSIIVGVMGHMEKNIHDIFQFVNKKAAFNLATWRNYPTHQFSTQSLKLSISH